MLLCVKYKTLDALQCINGEIFPLEKDILRAKTASLYDQSFNLLKFFVGRVSIADRVSPSVC